LDNVLTSVVNSSLTQATDSAAQQKAITTQLSNDPVQKAITAYNNAANNTAPSTSDPIQSVINAYKNSATQATSAVQQSFTA